MPIHRYPRFQYTLLVLSITTIAAVSYYWFDARAVTVSQANLHELVYTTHTPAPFPVGIDPHTKTITESPLFDQFIEQHYSELQTSPSRLSKLGTHIENLLKQSTIYQHLASPAARQLLVREGDRPDMVLERARTLFSWDDAEQAAFTNIIDAGIHAHGVLPIIPGTYTLPRKSSPIAVYTALETDFLAKLKSRYPEETANILSLPEAFIIASLLEREAADFYDMRYISGIIWNRLFIDMNLQIDATLQYAKATDAGITNWPPVTPDDKYIESPFNTYEHTALPPAPIAIPSIGAIIATLNPKQTDCLFYFHNRSRNFFCSPTYDEHVDKLIQQYGQGR